LRESATTTTPQPGKATTSNKGLTRPTFTVVLGHTAINTYCLVWGAINTYYCCCLVGCTQPYEGGPPSTPTTEEDSGFRVEMIRTDKINSMLKSERRREDHPQDRREFCQGVRRFGKIYQSHGVCCKARQVQSSIDNFIKKSSVGASLTSPGWENRILDSVYSSRPSACAWFTIPTVPAFPSTSRPASTSCTPASRSVLSSSATARGPSTCLMPIYIYSSEPVRTLIFCNSKRTVDELGVYMYISLSTSVTCPRRGFLFPMARSSSSPETPDSSNATSKLAGRPTAVTVYDYCPKTYNVRIQCRTSPLLISGLPHS
jgi:hypothetical protein